MFSFRRESDDLPLTRVATDALRELSMDWTTGVYPAAGNLEGGGPCEMIPCPECGGQGIAHCCDGICEQPSEGTEAGSVAGCAAENWLARATKGLGAGSEKP